MNKKSAAAVLFVAASVLMTGCTLSGSVENLLSPPVLYDEQEEIFSALTKAVGENITLEYPRSGAYRSAFIISDIDSDGGEEALVFYSSREALRINILDTDEDGKWLSVCDFPSGGTIIDRVVIAPFGSADRTSIIIGCGESGTDRLLKVYTYDYGRIDETYTDVYSSFFLFDLDNDGKNSLCVIRPNNENIGKRADFSVIDDNGMLVSASDTISLDSTASEFVGVVLGNVGENTPAVYIDGLSAGQLSTEIIYQVGGTLRNPLYLEERGIIRDTLRSKGYPCTDIDLDGIVEIPTLSYFPGYNQDSRSEFLVTNWNVYSNFTINKKYASCCDLEKGFCFIIPARWDGLVTVKRDENNGDIVFYKYVADLMNSTEELLRISAVKSDYYSEKIENGYVWLKSRDNTHYFYKLPDNSDEPLILTTAEIVNNFYILT